MSFTMFGQCITQHCLNIFACRGRFINDRKHTIICTFNRCHASHSVNNIIIYNIKLDMPMKFTFITFIFIAKSQKFYHLVTVSLIDELKRKKKIISAKIFMVCFIGPNPLNLCPAKLYSIQAIQYFPSQIFNLCILI